MDMGVGYKGAQYLCHASPLSSLLIQASACTTARARPRCLSQPIMCPCIVVIGSLSAWCMVHGAWGGGRDLCILGPGEEVLRLDHLQGQRPSTPALGGEIHPPWHHRSERSYHQVDQGSSLMWTRGGVLHSHDSPPFVFCASQPTPFTPYTSFKSMQHFVLPSTPLTRNRCCHAISRSGLESGPPPVPRKSP